ncbi:endonuclease [Fictibacillus barbaricus]|uniref:Endonuclease I n=1 Tax=Fictibacillus barbaricus TaxID=182136 RepID=A0ABU1TWA9_9BACL|nr:endonuclease [Fictibacillus barbaricus]MDR7071482.1 endonuclease I [Fictibacillus barbaricus]
MKRHGNKKFLSLFSVVIALAISTLTFIPTLQATGDGTSNSPYSVSQAISNQNNGVKAVQGYVVGQPTAASTVVTSNYPNDYALALADSESESNTANMVYVQIPASFRSTFGLKTNPSLKGTVIKVTGNLTAYFSHPGLKDQTAMEKTSSSDPEDPPTEPTDPPTYDDSYYDPARGKTGVALKTALHNIIDDHTELSYSAVWEALKVTDQDPNNSNNVILLYTGRSQSKNSNGSGVNDWNREHVWAKSHGNFGTAMGPGTDLHHLRPTDASVNSSRGNLDFDNGGTEDSEAKGNYHDSDSWEPRDAVKGDVARMIFYMAVRYEGDSGEPQLEMNNNVNNGTAPYMGKMSILLQWNEQDPVDDWERNRNNIIYEDYQHNRNPFIDHPEYADEIW